MVKVECEQCKKDVLHKQSFYIEFAETELYEESAVSGNSGTIKEIKGDGRFCSEECLKDWVITHDITGIPYDSPKKKARK